jgi:hypothetical protein
VLFIVITQALIQNDPQVSMFANLVPWVLNIGGLIVFAIVRSRVAKGMLVAYAVALGVALLAGIFLLAVCFSAFRSGP